MTGPIFDTHAHYSAHAFDADRYPLLDSLPGKGVVGVCEQATHSGDAPRVLEGSLCLKEHPNVFFAGQITGFEGYMESAACGLLAARSLYARLEGKELPAPPADTMCGALVQYLTTENKHFQPMGANMGILPPLPEESRPRDKRLRYMAAAQRAVASFQQWLDENAL